MRIYKLYPMRLWEISITVGYLLDCHRTTLQEKELIQGIHQYVGVYSMLQKPKETPKPKIEDSGIGQTESVSRPQCLQILYGNCP